MSGKTDAPPPLPQDVLRRVCRLARFEAVSHLENANERGVGGLVRDQRILLEVILSNCGLRLWLLDPAGIAAMPPLER